MSIPDLATGSRAIALLGMPGSGRTTALQIIALWSLGQVRFPQPVDRVQERLDQEEAALSKSDREIRIKQRASIEQRAKERLAQEQGITFEEAEKRAEQQQTFVPLFNRLMPVYVHLADIDPTEIGSEVDPAEPLVRAVQYRVGRITSSTIPRSLYGRLNRGQALVLIDGYDDLPEEERERKLAWVRAFITQYGENFIIVSGPAIGYGALTQIGLAPVFLRPWSGGDTSRAAQRWTEAWGHFGKRRRTQRKPDETVIQRAYINNQALYPAELTMKLWANFADDVEVVGIEGWLRAYVKRMLPKDQPFETVLPQLAQIAAIETEHGFITEANFIAAATGAAMPAPAEPPPPAAEGEAPAAATAEEKKPVTVQGKLLSTLERVGLLVEYKGRRYRFRHCFLTAYLASMTLANASADELAAKALNPLWNQALAYAAMHSPVDEAVRARLRMPADLLQNHVLQVGRWLAYASSSVSWRGPLLKHLGNMMTSPSRYPLIRERAAAALVDTRDKEALYIYRQAARNADPVVRKLACLCMGALGDADSIRDLIPLLQDRDSDVQLAAGMALGAIGTQDALEAMIDGLTSGSEQLRQAIAEAFAAIPEEGYPVLYDAIEDSEMMLRRAAVFGLRRIKTSWAIIAIFKAFLEDEQWYVRSAAQQAFQEMQADTVRGPVAYPPPNDLYWLTNWAASRGETVPAGDGANQMLLKALQEGEPKVRALAAMTAGQLGMVRNTKALYNALRDRQEEVRATAYSALGELQRQIGEPLPSPN